MKLIPIENLFFMLIPLIFVWYFYNKWIGEGKEILYATARMVGQLLAVGYILIYIFENKSWYTGIFIIFIMISMSSLIVLRNIKNKDFIHYAIIFLAILIGGSVNLALVIKFVLNLSPFYNPKYIIPIAGMVYANSMNSVSLVAERLEKEFKNSKPEIAIKNSFKASMIPRINAFLAVGIVSLPGMMTGQILSGVDPLIAVRYQIVVMAMILGSSGISVIFYIKMIMLIENKKKD